MPLIPDEQEFDPRSPPWAVDAGVSGEQPDAMLSSDASGDPERLIEIDPVPDPRIESEPDERQPPQDAAQAQARDPVQSRRDARMEASQETQRDRRRESILRTEDRQQAVRVRQHAAGRAEQQAPSRPSAFPLEWTPQGGGFQHVVAGLDVPDEIPLAEERTIAREEPGLAMESQTKIAEMEDQLASTIEVQSHNMHNSLSRLRDVETAFMRNNYI